MKSNAYFYSIAAVCIAICAVVGFAVWFTKNPDCLWGLVLIPIISSDIIFDIKSEDSKTPKRNKKEIEKPM